MKPLTFRCMPEDVKKDVWIVPLPALHKWPSDYEVIVLYRDAIAPTVKALLPQSIEILLPTDDLENYRLIVARNGSLYTVVCDDSNNTKESIAQGNLNVDMVFHGSLAEYVKERLEGDKVSSAALCGDTILKGDLNG